MERNNMRDISRCQAKAGYIPYMFWIIAAIAVGIVGYMIFRPKGGAGPRDRLDHRPPIADRSDARRAEAGAAAAASRPLLPSARRAPESGDNLRYRIHYADVDGVVTERSIRLIAVQREYGRAYIVAHCALRDAERSFRADRILAAWHDDGRKIAAPFEFFAALSLTASDGGPDFTSALAKARPGLLVLIWIARADRDLSEAEIETALDYVAARQSLGRKAAGQEWSRAIAGTRVEAIQPTFNEAAGALSRLAFGGREAALVREFADRIVGTGGVCDEKALARLKRLFGA
jgi:hypothetical protein